MRARSLAAAATVALLTSPLAMPPAAAAMALQLTCTMNHGPRSTSGGAECLATGIVGSTSYMNAPATMAFSTVVNCPRQDAVGTLTISGGVSMTFSWVRVGTDGVITTSGGHPGTGPITFLAPCPTPGETAVFTIGGP